MSPWYLAGTEGDATGPTAAKTIFKIIELIHDRASLWLPSTLVRLACRDLRVLQMLCWQLGGGGCTWLQQFMMIASSAPSTSRLF